MQLQNQYTVMTGNLLDVIYYVYKQDFSAQLIGYPISILNFMRVHFFLLMAKYISTIYINSMIIIK
jgi:hypothetical protein